MLQDHSRFSAELLQRRADALHVLGREAEAVEAWRLAHERDARIPAEPAWSAQPSPATLDKAARVGPPPT